MEDGKRFVCSVKCKHGVHGVSILESIEIMYFQYYTYVTYFSYNMKIKQKTSEVMKKRVHMLFVICR